jgi:serine/threonine-protein kinase
VQDCVDGVDLAELDQARRRALGVGLPPWFVADVLAEIAGGLAAAHRTGVLLRALKPSNLFLSPEEGVKLGDFRVAMARRGTAHVQPEFAGTLEYMAPETLASGAFHRATDVYGLGATPTARCASTASCCAAVWATSPGRKPTASSRRRTPSAAWTKA